MARARRETGKQLGKAAAVPRSWRQTRRRISAIRLARWQCPTVLPHEYKKDPSLLEIRAAAYASRGDYPAASKPQSQAIEEATRLGWNLQPLQQRASTYASRQPWRGDLLNF